MLKFLSRKNIFEVFAFFVGILCGIQIFLWTFTKNGSSINRFYIQKYKFINISQKYNTELADKLFDEVKILCLILTQPSSHKTKAYHVNNTWGYKCNKLIFLSTENDENFETFSIHRNESRKILWGKVRNGFQQAYLKYYNEYDWFLKGDDDSYFVMENLRQSLYQYNPNTSIIIGHKYVIEHIMDGYLAGAGYILSRKALEKFAKLSKDSSRCFNGDNGAEDAEMGDCLKNNALFIDGHDEYGEKQFFPLDVTEHMSHKQIDPNFWYTNYQWFKTTQGGLKCCSKNIICTHYITPPQMHRLNYLIYNLHPFGLQKDDLELKRKLTFQEIVQLADETSSSPIYVKHKIFHNFDKDEIF